MKTPDRKGYIYCQKHDIFFNPRLKKEADEENEKLKSSGLYERIDACPMCKQEIILTVLKIHASENDKLSQRKTLMQGSEDLSRE